MSLKPSDPFSHSCSVIGAWWEVDLGEGVAVSRVTIRNRINCCWDRLSNSVVSLRNHQGTTLKTYRIGDATNIPVFDINFAGINGVLITKAPTPALTNAPTGIPTFDATLVWRVRVQLEGTNALHMSEVQVYDTSGVNRALNKPATQSSTATGHSWGPDPASKAVNGALNDFSHTNEDAGKYYTLKSK